MRTRVHIVFYSMYGHLHAMAEAVAEGAREVPETDVVLSQVPELVPHAALEKSGALAARARFSHIPVAEIDDLRKDDAIIFGTPTRFGNMCAQMKNFIDQTGALWAEGALIGKVASVFVGTATQHGGQETTALTFYPPLLHQGMIIVGVPYSEARLTTLDEITGGGPYGSGTLSGSDGKRQPSANELAIAKFQGRHVAQVARALKQGRGTG
ncbi:TrpR binding protein WrbA [mine drainage metagenome]|uniref:TrpR binding protein WrbA n=1 Tax=mine drainage metagenome TaxID=410659 RepID=T1C5M8_9ZZZZ